MKKLIFTLALIFSLVFAQAQSVMIVNDDNVKAFEYLPLVEAVITAGFTVDTFNFTTDTTELTYQMLQGHNFIIWYLGNDRVATNLWDTTSTPGAIKFYPALQQYYENKDGAILIDGLDIFLPLIVHTTGDVEDFNVDKPYVFEPGSFVYDTLGIASWDYESYTDDGQQGVPEMDVADNNTIITLLNPIQWKWSTLWRADGWTVVDDAYPLYVLGPDSYPGAGKVSFFRYNSNGVDMYISSVRMAAIGSNGSINQNNINLLIGNILAVAFSDVEQNNNLTINVYPNPASDVIYINTSKNSFVQIFDLSGKQIAEFNVNKSIQIDVSNWNSGVYLVKVISDGKVFTNKIVVQ